MNGNDVMKMVENWEKMKEFLYPILLPEKRVVTEKDVSKRFLDLEVCIVIRFTETSVPIHVTREMLVKWNISEEHLYEQAMKNLLEEKYVFCSLEELVERMVGEKLEIKEAPIMILTNDMSWYGAAEMLNLPLLSEYASEKACDLYILPSSVHEVLMIEVIQEVQADELKALVMNVNQEKVPPEEQLSDRVYYFSRKSGKISIAV